MPVVPFTTGFSDFFADLARGQYLSDSSDIDLMFDRLQDYNAKSVRIAVNWANVESTQGEFNWYDYGHLALYAYSRGFKVFPHVWGAPAWLGSDRVHINGNLYYPKESAHASFGNFAAETLSFFSLLGVTRAIEIWNEPNHPNYNVPVDTYKSMLNECLGAVAGRSYPFTPTVVSGGLSMGEGGYWLTYLNGFKGQCHPYAVGIHPYSFPNLNNPTQSQLVDAIVDGVKAKYQQLQTRSRPISG